MKYIFILLIRLYQWTISPLLGNCCRFYPTCSDYAQEVIRTQGIARGGWLTLKRIIKCQPWNPGEVDLPPHPTEKIHSD